MTQSGSKKSCKQCNGIFSAVRSTAQYCSDKCKKAARRSSCSQSKARQPKQPPDSCVGSVNGKCPVSKTTPFKASRIKPYRCRTCSSVESSHNHLKRFLQSSICLNVIRCIEQAGTIETFQSLQDLDDYVSMVRLRRSYESNNREEIYWHICHLFPLKSDGTVGLTNSSNCIIGHAQVNIELGNKTVFTQAIEGTHYIQRTSLNDRWKVKKGNLSEARRLIVEYFGEAELLKWSKAVGFSPVVKSDYKPPAKNREALFYIMYEQVGIEACMSDVETWIDLASAWTEFCNQDRMNDGDFVSGDVFARDSQLELVGRALQFGLLEGNVEFFEIATEMLGMLTGQGYVSFEFPETTVVNDKPILQF